MLKKHFDGLGFKKDARDNLKKEKGADKGDDKDDDGFPAVHDCYMIWWTLDVADRKAAKEGMP